MIFQTPESFLNLFRTGLSRLAAEISAEGFYSQSPSTKTLPPHPLTHRGHEAPCLHGLVERAAHHRRVKIVHYRLVHRDDLRVLLAYQVCAQVG